MRKSVLAGQGRAEMDFLGGMDEGHGDDAMILPLRLGENTHEHERRQFL